ncbi:helix-turn-helix domain-containing protein [Methylobacterium nigriterrae]|uniref:helix-turn-helix domain-containing protein n=1 Tax=Methylobacterium nigriterrae TaxID=3127512 RepID=UPI003D66F838
MARAALNWAAIDLARASGVSLATVQRFEQNKGRPHSTTLMSMRQALENAGVVFLAPGDMAPRGPGVCLRERM